MEETKSRGRTLTFEHVIIAAAVLVGVATGTHIVSDNSLLLHLRTGIGIFDTHHVPHSDPYSFTAHGHLWIVQSWLPEVIYAAAWKLGGGHLFQLFNVVLFAAIATLMALLARTGNWPRTLLVLAVSIGIGYSQWTSRPAMFGMLFLVLLVWIMQRRSSPYWLVPIGILWVNSHGSWPLGLVLIGAMAIGEAFDKRSLRAVRPDIPYFGSLLAGVLVGGLLSPAGWRILLFPLSPIGRSEAFSRIIEWQSPNFRSTDFGNGLLVLFAFLVLIAIIARHRQTWRNLLPLLVFTAASLLGLRNLPALGVVALPILVSSLTRPNAEGKVPSKAGAAGIVGGVTIGVMFLTGVVVLANMFLLKPFDFTSYPVKGIEYLNQNNLIGPGHKVAAPDFIGNYLEYLYGDKANVFIDDRYDMYPNSVEKDSLVMSGMNKDVKPVLDKYQFDAIVQARDSRLAQYLMVNPDWKLAWSDEHWQIFVPRSSSVQPTTSK